MAVDIRFATNQIGPFNALDVEQQDPTFGQVIGAQLGYSYRPIIDYISNVNTYSDVEFDPTYDPRPDMVGYEDYVETLAHAKNAEHMSVLKNQLDENMKRRETMAAAGFWTNVGAGFFDPVNLIALPFGGPAIGILKSAGRGALAAGTAQVGLEGIRAPFDPLGTTSEVALNVGATTVFGGLINSAISIPITRRAEAFRKTEQSHKEFMEAAGVSEDISTLSPADVLNKAPRDERAFAAATDQDIRTAIDAEQQNIFGYENRLKEINETDRSGLTADELDNLNDETASLLGKINQAEATISVNKHERALRSIEDAGGAADVYDIAPSLFVDSPFFKAVTTPMKRGLNSKVVNSAKSALLKLGHDSGLALNMNKYGMSVGPSVYQKSVIMEGEWVQANSALTDIWTKTLGFEEGARRPMGINVADIVERGSKIKTRKDRTYGTWLREVSRKRINGLAPDNEMEGQAIDIMNKFYKRWEDRLEDIGLIGSRRNLEKKVREQEYKLDAAKKDLEKWETLMKEGKLVKWAKKTGRNPMEIRERKEQKILRFEQAIEENKMSVESLADVSINPANEDVFMPRYWDTNKIRKNRAELEKIIADWYKNNPVIYKKENGKFTRVQLDPSDKATAARAKETVDGILGLKDTLHPENIAYGFGKSKHLRHRELDIPNRLVYDFIVQDPIAIMKAYTHRTAGVYQFNKMFGNKPIAEVLDDLEDEMIMAGNSQKEINAYRRDFVHMYDRIVGSPVHNFDRIDFKAAQMVKDLAYMNYLGSAGFSAISDFSRIIMEHEMGDILRGLAAILERDKMKLSIEETNLLGEAIDILKGSAHIRQTDNMTNNPLQNSAWDTARNVYNVANLLGPMTQIAKEFDGLLRGHMLIKLSKQWVDGSISQKDATYLARYGITRERAEVYARAPVQQTKFGLYIPNTSAWNDTIQFPDTTAKIITGPTNSFDGNRYKPAFYREGEPPLKEGFIRVYHGGAKDSLEEVGEFGRWVSTNRDYAENYGSKKNELFFMDIPENDPRVMPDPLNPLQTAKKGFTFNFELSPDEAALLKNVKQKAIYLDEDYIRDVMWFERGWENPRTEGVRPLPDGFIKSPNDLVTFIKMHEIMHTKYRPKDLKIDRRKKNWKASYENAINDLAIKELKDQPRISADDTEAFRTAMQSGILNTVMMGTPADRPIITDGVVYVPHRIAKTFGYEEDSLVKGYSRVESGLLGLPFQFYSYSLAAMNKVTAAYTQGQIKNPMTGVIAAMGLGYLAVQIKTPDWAWEQMEWSDRFARSFDQSGLVALYSDLLYSSINTSMALGYGNYMDGIISPKFPQDEDYVDAATGILGAGPSIAVGLTVDPLESFINGEAGEGMKTFIRNLPFMRVWLWKDQVNAMTKALEEAF